MVRRVGILGGTFDPLHYGHLAAARGAGHLAGLDQVVFVPTGMPPHKVKQPITPAADRVTMLRLALAGEPMFSLSSVEIDRPGPHYTVNTLELLATQHPDWHLHFITGMDGFVAMETWKDYRRLLGAWDVLVVTRPDTPRRRRVATTARLGPELMTKVQFLEIPGVAIASHQLRRLAQAGYPLDYLVPPAVDAYIREHQLYGAKDM